MEAYIMRVIISIILMVIAALVGFFFGAGMNEAMGLIGEILLYLVLALVVLIGGPFALGFWLGGVRQRAKAKKAGNN